MEMIVLVLMIAFGALWLKSRDQARRVALLGRYLMQFQIEKLMENLTQGYLRALGESDPERQAPIWAMLNAQERDLADQFSRFASAFASVADADARVSTLPLALPYASRLFPRATFDLRQALAVHASGIAEVVENRRGLAPRDKAYTLSAELFLMQHTCHWYCRSRAVASARLLGRHQTSYAQVLAAVAPATRQAYEAVIAA
jgi:hypothetical protein